MDRPNRQTTGAALKALGWVIVIGLLGCHRPQQQSPAPPEPAVQGETVTFAENAPQKESIVVQPAEPRTLAVTHLSGRLYWSDDSTVRVFTPVAGRVTRVLADLGQGISAGAPLAEIDSPDFGQARADARTASGNLAAADKTYTRTKMLFDHGAAAQKDVEAAEAAWTAALAERDRAEARLANYGGSEQDTNELYLLRSPVAGVLVEKTINPGQEVRADMMLANAPSLFAPLFVVGDPTALWLQLDVAESDLPALRTGQTLRVTCQAFPGKVFEGTLANIGDEMDPATRTIKVRGVVRNPDELLKAEMYVTVDVAEDVSSSARAGVEISSKAIFLIDSEPYLFIEESPGTYRREKVTIGVEQDGKVPVFTGVAPGQRVVTEGALLLQSLVEPAD